MESRPEANIMVNFIPRIHPAMEISSKNEWVVTVQNMIKKVTGNMPSVHEETFWADSGLLNGLAKMPTLMFGPGGIGVAHSDHEYIEIDQLAAATEVYVLTAKDICG